MYAPAGATLTASNHLPVGGVIIVGDGRYFATSLRCRAVRPFTADRASRMTRTDASCMCIVYVGVWECIGCWNAQLHWCSHQSQRSGQLYLLIGRTCTIDRHIEALIQTAYLLSSAYLLDAVIVQSEFSSEHLSHFTVEL